MSKFREKIHVNTELIEHIKERSIAALQDEAYIETAVIMFQINEQLLRICIEALATKHGVSEKKVDECAWIEISIPNLLKYLDLLDPDNQISDKFATYNKARNKIMHKLFHSFTSIEEYQERLKEFCRKSIAIHDELMDFVRKI